MRAEGRRLSYFILYPSAVRLLTDPFAEQCGFPKAGGGRDERHAGHDAQALIQPLDQAGARDELWSRRRDVKLCG